MFSIILLRFLIYLLKGLKTYLTSIYNHKIYFFLIAVSLYTETFRCLQYEIQKKIFRIQHFNTRCFLKNVDGTTSWIGHDMPLFKWRVTWNCVYSVVKRCPWHFSITLFLLKFEIRCWLTKFQTYATNAYF